MKLLRPLFTIMMLLLIVSCGKDESDSQSSGIKKNDNKNSTSIYSEASRLEMPKLKGGQSILLVHKTNDKYGVNFSTEWDIQKKSQRWSCYQMHEGNKGGSVGRYQEGYPYDDLLDYKNYFAYSDGSIFDPFWNSATITDIYAPQPIVSIARKLIARPSSSPTCSPSVIFSMPAYGQTWSNK